VDVTIVDPVREPVPADWDALVDERRLVPLWRSALLTAVAWSAQTPTLMAVVRGPTGRPRALFHARHLGLPADPRRFRSPGRRPAVGLVECRLHPVGSVEGYAFAAGASPVERAQAVAAFEDAVGRRLGLRCAGVAYRHVAEPDLPAFRRRGPSLSVPVLPDMAVENRWSDPEDYLRSLRKKWRGRLRRIRDTVDADPTVQVGWEPTAPAAELSPLVQEVRDRHSRSWPPQPPVPAHYLAELVERPETSLLTYRERGGRLLAFVAVHDNGEELSSGFWGSRALTDGGRPDLYFDQYLRSVERMLELGRARLRLGKGMNEIKARCGATPSPRFAVARPGRPPRR
jgi:hypothetical protein